MWPLFGISGIIQNREHYIKTSSMSHKVCPVHLAARRQRELMCAIKYPETTELERYDLDLVDTTGLKEPQHARVVGGAPIIPKKDRSPVWETVD